MNKFFIILEAIKVYGLIKRFITKFFKKGENNMNGEKAFIESKKAWAFVIALVTIAISCLVGYKIGMPTEMINAMTSKIMVVALGLILGQSGIDIAKKIMDILAVVKMPVVSNSKPALEDESK